MNGHYLHHVEPRQLISFAIQMTCFHIKGTFVVNVLMSLLTKSAHCEYLNYREQFQLWIREIFFDEKEAATGVVNYKKVFLKIPQNSQENKCDGVSFLITL